MSSDHVPPLCNLLVQSVNKPCLVANALAGVGINVGGAGLPCGRREPKTPPGFADAEYVAAPSGGAAVAANATDAQLRISRLQAMASANADARQASFSA